MKNNIEVVVASMCGFDSEHGVPYGGSIYLNPYQDTNIIEAALSRYIQLSGECEDLFYCGDFNNDPIIDLNKMVEECGFEKIQTMFDEMFQKSAKEIIELYFQALEEHDNYEIFTLKRSVDMTENQIIGSFRAETDPISLRDIVEYKDIETSFNSIDVEAENALWSEAKSIEDKFYAENPSIDFSEDFVSDEKGVATFVRWLDAYIDSDHLYPVEDLWNFETSGVRQVAVEGLQTDKTYTVSDYLDNITVLKETEITNRYYSGIGRSNYGLLIDVRKSTFIKIYNHDVYSGPEDGKTLTGTNTDGTKSTSDINLTRALCRSVESGYTEAFFENPSYCAIVIKKPIEEMNDHEASRVTELVKLSGLPVVDLTKMIERKTEVKYDDNFEIFFNILSSLWDKYIEFPEEDKYEEFVEDIEEDEED